MKPSVNVLYREAVRDAPSYVTTEPAAPPYLPWFMFSVLDLRRHMTTPRVPDPLFEENHASGVSHHLPGIYSARRSLPWSCLIRVDFKELQRSTADTENYRRKVMHTNVTETNGASRRHQRTQVRTDARRLRVRETGVGGRGSSGTTRL